MAQTMAEYLIQQGEEHGEIRAKRESLLKLLHLRFDPVPETLIAKVSVMRSLSRLDTLFEQVVTAQTLDEIEWEDK
ncbi:hypothetical protein C6501_17560 [Candidatus Poribacteria bacterium]|nr:MAG: hypothetical protein C6501_17560 [Candidatus Poribacteria bacterium]